MQLVLNELKSAQDFVQARQKHKQQVNLNQILSSMSNNFVKKLNNNHLSPAELTTVITQLENSPYMNEDTAKIISLLDEKWWVAVSRLSPQNPTRLQTTPQNR